MQKSSCNTMRILDLAIEFLPNNGDLEESLLKIVDRSNTHYIKDALRKRQPMKVQMKTILVGLDEEEFKTKGSLSNVVCSLFVQYFASGNHGFVKLLKWNDLNDQEIENTRELLKEALSTLNKVHISAYLQLSYVWALNIIREHLFSQRVSNEKGNSAFHFVYLLVCFFCFFFSSSFWSLFI